MTMTTQVASTDSSALAWAVRDEAPRSGWAAPVRAEIGTLPWSRLRRVTEYIEEHLDRDLSLAALGAVVSMSPFHFARLFRRSTGVPPHRFVVCKRIDHAIALLVARERSIAQIARMVGFRTPSHFTTVFRRVTGLAPRAYRGAILGKASPVGREGRDELPRADPDSSGPQCGRDE
jgi:AraC-like DNA-binding protein